MRTYGRITNPNGTRSWVEVSTDASGFNDMVWVTTLIQCLLLNLNESPFYADRGIPAKASLIMQVAPDTYVVRTQQQFAQYFANLSIARLATAKVPTYQVNVTTHLGVKLTANVPVPS